MMMIMINHNFDKYPFYKSIRNVLSSKIYEKSGVMNLYSLHKYKNNVLGTNHYHCNIIF